MQRFKVALEIWRAMQRSKGPRSALCRPFAEDSHKMTALQPSNDCGDLPGLGIGAAWPPRHSPGMVSVRRPNGVCQIKLGLPVSPGAFCAVSAP